MNTALETLKETLSTLANAPLVLAVLGGLLGLGWLLKAVPLFPNRYIPATVVAVGSVLGFFVIPMQGPADWAFQVANPEAADVIRRVSIGMVLGLAAWTVHRYAFKRLELWLAKKLGAGSEDTTLMEKPPDEK